MAISGALRKGIMRAGAQYFRFPRREGADSGLFGGEGGIRTPETLSSLHAFQACALNRARPPLRARTCDYASRKPAEPVRQLTALR